jgi:hypothetical protein
MIPVVAVEIRIKVDIPLREHYLPTWLRTLQSGRLVSYTDGYRRVGGSR